MGPTVNLCMKHQIFLAVDQVQGPFDVQGFVGLGPQNSGEDLSVPMSLYADKNITKMKVGLNFENPAHKGRVSTITFGYYDEDHIHDGEAGLNYFANKGTDNWSINLDDLRFNGKELQPVKSTKLAHIDSAGPNI